MDVVNTDVDERVERIRQKALTKGAERTKAVKTAVRAAMKVIDEGIAENEDIYPDNDGVLNLRELARRAGIHWTTLHGKKYEEFLAEEVKTWLKDFERKTAITKLEVRRTLAERVADWKELCGAFVDAIRVSELDRQEAEAQCLATQSALEQAQGERHAMFKMFEAVKEENEKLRRALAAATGGKIVAFPSNGVKPPDNLRPPID